MKIKRLKNSTISKEVSKGLLALSCIALFGFNNSYAQIGIGTTSPDDSAILELQSSNSGFLPPRLTNEQRDLLTTPANGLMIYNYSSQCVQVFNALHWFDLCTKEEIIKPLFAEVNENGTINLQAPEGYVFNEVSFASYGTPTGSNGDYQLGSCHAANSESIVENLALGNNSFSISASNGVFGDPCGGVVKKLFLAISYAKLL
ncbi:SUEL-type lectin domain-containing protein [Psychroflexus planctonicus]|uniref:SUEL-type lectin domain-containing protein n=1 Tax=Psychroflexus planctonicus TaxID=1526575 RepID=A0ABQ1SE98_9FLAO|nr:SUEL-type lectin domain-containing protein [Psychroflexus planctonicus]GGE26709.1 hypothetical protein GCM10010832_04270 [Psychroflexus planctonicus]